MAQQSDCRWTAGFPSDLPRASSLEARRLERAGGFDLRQHLPWSSFRELGRGDGGALRDLPGDLSRLWARPRRGGWDFLRSGTFSAWSSRQSLALEIAKTLKAEWLETQPAEFDEVSWEGRAINDVPLEDGTERRIYQVAIDFMVNHRPNGD